MYRVILFLAFLAYCSSFPFTGSNSQKSFNTGLKKDDIDVVDNVGAGYSYFRKQDIDTRPSMRPSAAINADQDISEYRHSSALDKRPVQNQVINSNTNNLFNKGFGQHHLFSNNEFEAQPWIQKSAPIHQQPASFQQDRSAMFKDFRGEQSSLLNQNVFSNQVQEVQPIGSQQILIRPSTLNIQEKTLNSQRNQQQLHAIPQQSTWDSQQQFTGYSLFNNQMQRPLTPSLDKEFVPQTAVKPPVITKFMNPQAPVRRVISQSQSAPQMSSGGW